MRHSEPFLCLYCAHLLSGFERDGVSYPSCTAYPEGIPNEITDNEADHRRRYPGDKGIRFAPSSHDDAEAVEKEVFPLLSKKGEEN